MCFPFSLRRVESSFPPIKIQETFGRLRIHLTTEFVMIRNAEKPSGHSRSTFLLRRNIFALNSFLSKKLVASSLLSSSGWEEQKLLNLNIRACVTLLKRISVQHEKRRFECKIPSVQGFLNVPKFTAKQHPFWHLRKIQPKPLCKFRISGFWG